MDKFEYKMIDFQTLVKGHYQEIDVNKLNELGNEGWELVNIAGECIFKRKINS